MKWSRLGSEPHSKMEIIILTGRVIVKIDITSLKGPGTGQWHKWWIIFYSVFQGPLTKLYLPMPHASFLPYAFIYSFSRSTKPNYYQLNGLRQQKYGLSQS
jgi:hypothetical protein